ncbi:hypothetical protein Gotri_000960 [Gossypium trilobum]|uniref:Uncharacterized protein n=1 Tax=Gossypium trilobum TaxID=34281 RepID=A0A7J9FD13_9ROSI|nr:hypothetical protein [Gossypium trilobum]
MRTTLRSFGCIPKKLTSVCLTLSKLDIPLALTPLF